MRIATLLCMLLAFAAAAEKRSFVINSATVKWEAMNPPGVPKGLTQKLLHDNKQNQLQSSIVSLRTPPPTRDTGRLWLLRKPNSSFTPTAHSIFT